MKKILSSILIFIILLVIAVSLVVAQEPTPVPLDATDVITTTDDDDAVAPPLDATDVITTTDETDDVVAPLHATDVTTTDGAVASDVGTLAATIKSLGTNMILMNLSSSLANVAAEYKLDSGANWPNVGDANSLTSFTIAPDGGQAFHAHYNSSMGSGQGSVTISSDQELAAVVQIQARAPQVPTFGAYSGITQPSEKFYVPFASRRLATANGVGNTVITIQNTETTPTDVSVEFISGANYASVHTEQINNIPAGSSFYYDLSNETDLSVGFYGSVVITAETGKKIAVVYNLFLGPNGLQSDNAFSQESLNNTWVVPIFNSRLANGLSTTVFVQNLSGSPMAAGSITMDCVRGEGSPGAATLSVSNPVAVANNGSAVFNPVVDAVNFSNAWYGACRISAPGNVVSYIQMRFVGIGGNDGMAAFGAINANSTARTVVVPSVAKRLANGYSTVLFVQNLSETASTNVTVTYKPSPLYVAAGGSSATVSLPAVNLGPGESLYQSHRISSGTGAVTQLPNGWYGTATFISDSQPIQGIAELTFLSGGGDNFQAHDLFTR